MEVGETRESNNWQKLMSEAIHVAYELAIRDIFLL
jgi:hypothetical protein